MGALMVGLINNGLILMGLEFSQQLIARGAKLLLGERIDFVSVVTPNRTHVPVSKAFLETGFNVVCDKPLAFNLEEALSLPEVVKKTGKVFALTHNE
jgi:predicted dehydrogenase